MYKVKTFDSLMAYERFLEREHNLEIVSVNTIKKTIFITYKITIIKQRKSSSKLPDPRGQEPVWSS